jgi:heterodisulfide reductase subunit C
MLQQVAFILVTFLAMSLAGRQFARIRRAILLGKPEKIEGQAGRRWKEVALIAFGQQKMFKQWAPALLHFFIYSAFLLTQIELIEILVDGFTGSHRLFASPLGGFYTFLIGFIEILSLLALGATIVFLARRTFVPVARLRKPEMRGWPARDGILILIGEILLIAGIFSMNGADVLLQNLDSARYPDTGTLAVSSWLGPMLFGGLSRSALVVVERAGWWLHILTVYAFLNYLPISKHLHILLAFPNVYYSRFEPRGAMPNMPEIMDEVKSMMGLIEEAEPPPADEELPEFGARDVFGLSWKTLLEAYTCTECGRCTEMCPANITGKKLSPRKIMMDIRDRLEEVSQAIDAGAEAATPVAYDDGKSLFDRITPEELHACTTCQACIEACPVQINPMAPLLVLRRYEVLTDSAGPSELVPMYNSIENSGSVWPVAEPRDAWTKGG